MSEQPDDTTAGVDVEVPDPETGVVAEEKGDDNEAAEDAEEEEEEEEGDGEEEEEDAIGDCLDVTKGMFVELREAATAKIAGNTWIKGAYYALLLIALAMFIISAGGVIASSSEDYTDVDTTLLNQLEFPAVFMCLNNEVFQGSVTAGTLITARADSDCRAGTYIEADGTVEEWLQTPSIGECKNLTTKALKNGDTDEQISYKLAKYFDTVDFVDDGDDEGTCVLLNTDGSFKPKRDSPSELIVGFEQQEGITDLITYGIVGFYEPGTDPFDKNDELIAQYYRVGFQDTMSMIGVSLDTLTDNTGLTLWGDKDDADEEKLYTVAATSFTGVWQNVDDDADDPKIAPKGDGATQTYVALYVSDFVSRQINITSKSFAEIWAELGGALTAALAIIAIGFKDEVVTKRGGGSYTVKVFRFKTMHDARKQIASWAKEEASEYVGENVAGSQEMVTAANWAKDNVELGESGQQLANRNPVGSAAL